MNKKYIIIGAIVVAILIIIGTIIGIKNKKEIVETTNAEIKDEEEISIEELPEEIEEEIVEESIKQEENEKNNKQTTKKQNNKTKQTSTTQTVSSKPVASNGKPYYIKVNYGANVVTVYSLDDEGNYTVPVKAMVCSTGTATPKSGKYKIQSRWEWLRLLGGVYGHYSTQITGNILFHSVPYLRKSPDSLEYWEYDKLRNKLLCRVRKT